MPNFTSPRLSLPLLAAGQAQKEVTHNEALALLDGLLSPMIENATTTVPPANPASGAAWLVASGATGAWQGEIGRIAIATDGGWRFVSPFEGLLLWDRAQGTQRRFHNGAWVLPNNLALPAGGATIDAEARTALANIAALLGKWGLIT